MSNRVSKGPFVLPFAGGGFLVVAVVAAAVLVAVLGNARADPAPLPTPSEAPTPTEADAGEAPRGDDRAAERANGRAENEREDEALDRLEDGDIDEEDRVAIDARGDRGAADVHDESWVSLVGLRRELQSGKNDLAGMVVVGLALDRLSAGPERRAETPALHVAASGDFPSALARDCVAAALRTAGLDGDARLESIVSRAHASAALPETRLRAMRLWDDANHTTTLATTDGTNYYDAVGANLVLEARLTWRLDRLVYTGDEPTLERLRLERQEARARLSTRTLEALFAWERARVDASAALPDSQSRVEADLRAAEARATLDVLTGGRFEAWERSP